VQISVPSKNPESNNVDDLHFLRRIESLLNNVIAISQTVFITWIEIESDFWNGILMYSLLEINLFQLFVYCSARNQRGIDDLLSASSCHKSSHCRSEPFVLKKCIKWFREFAG